MSTLHQQSDCDSNDCQSGKRMLSADLSEAFNTLSSLHRKECQPKYTCEEKVKDTADECGKAKFLGNNYSASKADQVMENQKIEAASFATLMAETEISRLQNSIAELEKIVMLQENSREHDISARAHPKVVYDHM